MRFPLKNLKISLILVFLCAEFSCQDITKSTFQNTSTDFFTTPVECIGYPQYIQSLILEKKIVNYSILKKLLNDTLASIDSVMHNMPKRDWFIYIYDITYGHNSFTIELYPTHESEVALNFNNLEPNSFTRRKLISNSDAQQLIETLETQISVKPNFHHTDGILKCGGTLIIYYSKNKFYCFSDYFGHTTKQVFLNVAEHFR